MVGIFENIWDSVGTIFKYTICEAHIQPQSQIMHHKKIPLQDFIITTLAATTAVLLLPVYCKGHLLSNS